MTLLRTLTLSLVVGLCVACGGSAGNTWNPDIDPANFVTTVTNAYYPLTPGTVYTFTEEDDGEVEDIRVEVTHDTKTVMGVTCIVVRDTATVDGATAEDTYDWFAQDKDGNVWYFGEDTIEYHSDGTSSKHGSWEAGVNGAKPGIVMKAAPKVGDAYYQEYLKGEAEDEAEVLSVTESVTVAHGSYTNCIQTKDFTALEPNVIEHKTYCSGVGVVKMVGVQGSNAVGELVSVTP